MESFATAQEHNSSTSITSNEEQLTLNSVFHQMTSSNIKSSNEKVENRHLTSSEKEGIDSVLHELLDTSLSSSGEGGASEPLGSDSTSNTSTSVSDKTRDLHQKPIDKDFQENFHSSTLHERITIPPLMTEELFHNNLRLISIKSSLPMQDSRKCSNFDVDFSFRH